MTRSVLAATLTAAFVLGAAACGGGSSPGSSDNNGQAPDTFTASFDTTQGTFVVTVHRSWAPRGADRFYNLVKDHFYDNQPLFRVLPGFVVQWGISSTPSVAQKWQNATINDDPVAHPNDKGTITFATSGPNTRTTQLFVNLADNTSLDSQGFSPFGEVTSGFDVFSKLYNGYGDTFDQGAFTQNGESWVRQNFPKLDWITSASLG
jgi:peptidyl-prolyl cis-trans isomerase A (cyclophilin A)